MESLITFDSVGELRFRSFRIENKSIRLQLKTPDSKIPFAQFLKSVINTLIISNRILQN